MIKGIHHVSMKCADREVFDRAVDFYTKLLGLSVKRSWSEGIMIDAGNCLIEIFNNGDGITEKGAVRHFAFDVDNCDEITERSRAVGLEVFVEPHDVVIASQPPCPARIAFIKGHLGEEIEFFQEK